MACPTRISCNGWAIPRINFGVTLVAALIVLPILYAAIRRAGRSWWIWGAAIVDACS